MRTSRALHVVLACALSTTACFDRTPRGTSSSVGLESAVHTAFRGPLHGKVVIRPPFPRVGQPVSFELIGGDARGGELLLSAAYDGRRPEDEGAVPPVDCAAAAPAVESRETRTEERTFDRAGRYEVRLLVLAMRCDESRAEIQVKAPLVVEAS